MVMQANLPAILKKERSSLIKFLILFWIIIKFHRHIDLDSGHRNTIEIIVINFADH